MKCQLWTLNGRQFSLSTQSTKLKLSQYYSGLFQWRSQRNNSCMHAYHFISWPSILLLTIILIRAAALLVTYHIFMSCTNHILKQQTLSIMKKKLNLWYYKVCLIFELYAWGNIDNNFNTKRPQYKSFIHWGPVENWY